MRAVRDPRMYLCHSGGRVRCLTMEMRLPADSSIDISELSAIGEIRKYRIARKLRVAAQ